MKNYKVKAKDLYVGMDFYHVEGSGAYSGDDVIVRITQENNLDALDENGAKPAGSLCIETISQTGTGKHWMNPDDVVYPVISHLDVNLFTKLKWRLRQLYYKYFYITQRDIRSGITTSNECS